MDLRHILWIGILAHCLPRAISNFLTNWNLVLELNGHERGLSIHLSDRNNNTKIRAVLGDGLNLRNLECHESSHCFHRNLQFHLDITLVDHGFKIRWISDNVQTSFRDCLYLNAHERHWFGGSEQLIPQWPIENMTISKHPYITSKRNSSAIAERYWLNSAGSYVFVDGKVPLFVDQNEEKQGFLCFTAEIRSPFLSRRKVLLEYVIVAHKDAKEAHLHAVQNYLGKPIGLPNERLVRYPIWTTWAKFKKHINDSAVVQFAESVAQHNFTGQLEIDDSWESCYGSATFSPMAFPDINSTVQKLRDLGFTVSLWTHPFVNKECLDATKIGRANGYFLKSINGGEGASWWNGNSSLHIDFTKRAARRWFKSRLRLLQKKHGIDSFKFDAGESDWAVRNAVLVEDSEAPNVLTSQYVRTCASFGNLIEVRTGWRSQDLPVLVRMIDKDSRWSSDNGLQSLIPTLLQMNLNGYTLVLPDMIGGNGYGDDQLTPELLVRWTQANVFMPVMQFSYLPWEIRDNETHTLAIVKKCIGLHEEYADAILRAMNRSVNYGTPVNPPIWWLDPENTDALGCSDEFLLGEHILVAPVMEQGASKRNIILPRGAWKDGNTNAIYEGPQIIEDYPAPIDTLPFFIRQ